MALKLKHSRSQSLCPAVSDHQFNAQVQIQQKLIEDLEGGAQIKFAMRIS